MGEILIKNAKLVLGEKAEYIVDILIEAGKIKKIKKNILAPKHQIIDAKNNYVLPGLIDPHVHFREPGLTHKEDFLTGSRACAKGGITTFLDMPNTVPPTTTVKLLDEKRILAKKSIVNFGFHFGASEQDINEIKKAKNVASTKVFLNISTGKLMITNDNSLEKIFLDSKLITVHAEDEEVTRAISLTKKTKKQIYLCHISLAKEIEMIKKAKQNNQKNIFVEVSPHHLFLTDQDKSYLNIMKPPLRTKHDVEILWKSIDEGLVDTIGSDHAPHLISEKKEKETYGVPGVETLLPLLIDAYNNKKISLYKIQKLTSENPAKIFKIKNKGKIEKGYDADLVIIDINLEKTIDKNDIISKCNWNPFYGKKLKGFPITTIVSGKIVYDGKNIFNNCGKEVEFDE